MTSPQRRRPEELHAAATPLAPFDHAGSDWNRIAAAEPHADPFCCRTEWQLSFHETFYPQRRVHVRTGGDSLVALAECDEPDAPPLLEPVECHWLFGCPLLGPRAVDLLQELLGDLAGQHGAPPDLLLSGIRRGGPLHSRIQAAFGARARIFLPRTVTLCSASLDGGLDGFLSRRSGSLRRNLRAAARRAAAAGVTWQRCVPRDATEAAATYARMLRVEQASWKGIGRCGMAEPPSRQFYDVMLRRLATSGGGRVMFARHGERDIGFIFGGMAGGVYRGQQFSYVEEWSAGGIGNLLQVEQVRWLCEEGAGCYHMGPLMDYKRHWTELRAPVDAVVVRWW